MTEVQASRPNQIVQGIAIILGSVLIMAFADAVVKLASADLTVWQIFVTRSLVAIPILFLLLRFTGISARPHNAKWTAIRSLLLVLTWLVFYASFPVLSLSIAATAAYTNPIITCLLTAALIGERVTARQWGGVCLGFLGVIAILKPGTDAFSWFTLLPLFSAVLYSLGMVLTRSKCQDEAPFVLALSLHLAFLVVGLAITAALAGLALNDETQAAFPFLLGDWASMGAREWGLMALIGVLSAIFFVGVARAYQIAPPPIIATFDYGYLISAAFWGFVFFAEQPDALTIAGMILITAAGVLVAARS